MRVFIVRGPNRREDLERARVFSIDGLHEYVFRQAEQLGIKDKVDWSETPARINDLGPGELVKLSDLMHRAPGVNVPDEYIYCVKLDQT